MHFHAHIRNILFTILCSGIAISMNSISTSGVPSTNSTDLPKKNFTGTVEGNDQIPYIADHIAIGSRSTTEHIVVYHQPKDPGTRPGDYATYLDLGNIKEIVTAFPSEKEHTVSYDAIEYVPIHVLFNNGAKTHTYLIEARKELFCDEIDGKQYIPHALKFTAVKRVVLHGPQRNALTYTHSSCGEHSDQQKRKDERCSHAGKAIDALTIQVESLPAEQKSTFRSMVDTIRNYVGAMCSTE